MFADDQHFAFGVSLLEPLGKKGERRNDLIYWGALNFKDVEDVNPNDDQSGAGALGIEDSLVLEAKDFCGAWKVLLPSFSWSISRNKPSSYHPGSRTVTLCHVEAEASSGNAPKRIEEETAYRIAAKLTFFHELTHCVQHDLMGQIWMIEHPILAETHADLFAAYWLTKEISIELFEALSPIAFAKGGTVEVGTHPFGCTRQSAVQRGMEIGSGAISLYGDLAIPECARTQLFKDSLSTAQEVLNETARPCDLASENWTNFTPMPCETCPNIDQVREMEKRRALANAFINHPPIKRKSGG